MILEKQSRPYPITKDQVWEAYKLVKKKGGAPGIDGLTIDALGANIPKHLYPVWNRLSSGSYFAPAVRRVEITKDDGSKRPLGIPTVCDRVAQTVIAQELEHIVDKHFHECSYGYRPNKSAHDAVGVASDNSWKYAWVIDMDIKGFFDNIDHGLLIRALRYFTEEKHIILYVKRWLKASIQLKDGSIIQNTEKGTPQGGVVSPVLANIFLHVVFDRWVGKQFPDCPFERFADDMIVHAPNETYARHVLHALRKRFEECKLELHPEKTKLVYCERSKRRKIKGLRHKSFDFLGFTFRPRRVMTKNGHLMYGFRPGISRKRTKRIVATCRKLRFNRWTHRDIHQVSAELGPKIRGWINYYGKFRLSEMKSAFLHLNRRLARWAFNKYKRFKRRKTVYYALQWLRGLAKKFPYLFLHWKYGFTP